jgi:hypothetical protein
MLRGQKVSFRASKTDLKRLHACNRESALVRNECEGILPSVWPMDLEKLTAKSRQKEDPSSQPVHSSCMPEICLRSTIRSKSYPTRTSLCPLGKRSTSTQNGPHWWKADVAYYIYQEDFR